MHTTLLQWPTELASWKPHFSITNQRTETTHFACSARAQMPPASGALADVPVCDSVQTWRKSVVSWQRTHIHINTYAYICKLKVTLLVHETVSLHKNSKYLVCLKTSSTHQYHWYFTTQRTTHNISLHQTVNALKFHPKELHHYTKWYMTETLKLKKGLQKLK